jgi:hypothetical protein
VRPKAGSAADRQLLAAIDRIGWTLMYISGNAPWPDFGFTVGLFANYEHPGVYPWQPGFSGDARAQLLNGDLLRTQPVREWAVCEARTPASAY